MKQVLHLLLEIAGCVLVTDFISGLLHWLEDAYGREDFLITGRLFTRPNILHHHNPRAFVANNWWRSSWDLICLGGLLLLAAWLLGCLTWHVWFVAALGANANQIHKWAHRSRQENGWLISFLQTCRILQSPRHHAQHHTDPKNSHYCVLTDFLNQILDRIRFWAGLERMIEWSLKVPRRVDHSVKAGMVQGAGAFQTNARPVFCAHEHSSGKPGSRCETVAR